MMNNVIKNKKGFTLIELAISMAITAIIIMGAVSIFFIFFDYFMDVHEKNQQQLVVDNVTEIVSRELRYSTELKVTDILPEYHADEEEPYMNLYSDDGKILRNNADLLDLTNAGQEITIEYSYDVMQKFNIYVAINVKNPKSGIETTEDVTIKLVNMELLDVPVSGDVTDVLTGTYVYYK